MILVTVGGQVAFDRLVRTVDAWALDAGRNDLYFQILDGAYEPKSGPFARELPFADFDERVRAADVLVSHAGMGTILRALELGKPILVLPRRAELGEQRNDHQLATARRLRETGRCHVALDEAELTAKLAGVDALEPLGRIEDRASEELLAALREFVQR